MINGHEARRSVPERSEGSGSTEPPIENSLPLRRWRPRALSASALAALALGACVGPEPLGLAEIETRIAFDTRVMFADQEALRGPLDFYEAAARGLKYNLDKRLKLLERGLAEARLEHVRTGLLPKAATQAGWRGRDNVRASSSLAIDTGLPSLQTSTSEDRHIRFADLAMIWNVLDFGITYVKARQEADQVLVAEERRIKVAQNLLMDIRDAYWRAVAAERLMPEVDRLLHQMDAAIRRSRRLIASGAGEPKDELETQRTLLVHKRDVVEVRRKLSLAKSELAALVNLPPGTRYRVAVPRRSTFTVPHLKANIQALELAALANRPELREEDLKGRIAERELDVAWLRLLPGIELRGGPNYDSNSFILNANWLSGSAIVTANLFDVLAAPRAIGFAEAAIETGIARRQALAMAVVTQLHISLQRFGLARDSLAASDALHRIDTTLADIAIDGERKRNVAEAEALQARSRRLVSALQLHAAYADVQAAFGRVLNSLGAHRLPEDLEALPLDRLAGELRRTLDDWRNPRDTLEIAGL